MPFRRKIRRRTIGKTPIQHCQTLIANVGAATAPATQVVLLTEAGARSLDGAGFNTTAGRDSDNECNIGDVCKYVNLFIQIGPREIAVGNDERNGWLEWAFVCVKESETAVPITQLGVLTLGTVCTNMFRNECIFTGNVPVGANQPASASIQIKIPRSKQTLRVGDEWRFITYYRDMNATAGDLDSNRLIKSYMYKSYQ